MKPFHYHEDPMYSAAAEILAQETVSEETQQLEESYPGAPVLTKAQKLQNIKARRKEEIDAIAKIRASKNPSHGERLSGDDLRRIDMHNEMLKKIDAREKQVMKMAEETELEEGVEQIADIVDGLKKGDKTNFGVVTDIGSNNISFKAKDLPITKIAFNQRKMGSKDFVLDKLVKLKEDASVEESDTIEEGNGSYGMGTATITAPGNKLHGKQVSIFHKFDDGRLNVQFANSSKKGDVTNLTLKKDQYKLD